MESPRICGRWWIAGALWLALLAPFAFAQAPDSGPLLSASQTVAGKRMPGETITVTATLNNSGGAAQPDNAGAEFTETMPKRLSLLSVTASSGSATSVPASEADGGVVQWDGSVPAMASVTITMTVAIDAAPIAEAIATQGEVHWDADRDGTNESVAVTDDRTFPGAADPNTFTPEFTLLRATQTVAGAFMPGGPVRLTIVIENKGTSLRPKSAGSEFVEVFPASLQLISVTSSDARAKLTPAQHTLTWSGSIKAGSSRTITVDAIVDPATTPGTSISSQGRVSYDFDNSGDNETSAPSYAGADQEAPAPNTIVVMSDFGDLAFAAGTKPMEFDLLRNDIGTGVTLSLAGVGQSEHSYGSVSVIPNTSLIRYQAAGPIIGEQVIPYTVNLSNGSSYSASARVRGFADYAATYEGLLQPPVGTAHRPENLGLVRVTLTKMGGFTATVVIGGEKFTATGVFDSAGTARFGSARATERALKRKPRSGKAGAAVTSDLQFSLQIGPDSRPVHVVANIAEDGTNFSGVVAERAVFFNRPFLGELQTPVPDDFLGKQTILLSPRDNTAGKTDASLPSSTATTPGGIGIGTITVAKSGIATLVATLPDGTAVTCTSHFSKDHDCFFYAPLYQRKGCLTGTVHFDYEPVGSKAFQGGSFEWFRPADAKAVRFTSGWPEGVRLDCSGSTFSAHPTGKGSGVFPGLNEAGEVLVHLWTGSETGAGAGNVELAATIDQHNKVKFVSPPAGMNPVLTISSSGFMSGSFLPAGEKKRAVIHGIVVQREKRAGGYFLTAGGGGGIRIEGK